jgi:small-conductance mechanosensitive channel
MGRLKVISELDYSIDAAFRKNNVTIPFPQRDVHFYQEA